MDSAQASSFSNSIQISEHCLAAPWQRFVAAATDVFILLLLHCFAALIVLAAGATETDNLASVGTAFSWLYLWAGNLCGATPGKRLWKLRVVCADGSRPTPRTALMRCIGYALAIIPLKIGLLPILFNKQRRGWHDSLAHTRVVKEKALQDGALEFCEIENAPRALIALPIPDLKAPLRRSGWVLLFYIVMAVIITWPLALHFRTRLAGYEGDNMVFAWNYWWFREAVLHGKTITRTGLFFYPEEISLLFHTMNFFNCTLAFPLQEKIGLEATYNLLMLLTFAACSFAAYWLLCSFTRDAFASAIIGLSFGFSSYFTGHSIGGHANLMSAQFIPLFALFCYCTLVKEQIRYALLAGLMLALSALCDWQYFLFEFVLAACLWLGLEMVHWQNREATIKWKFGRRTLRRTALTAMALFVGTLCLSPLLGPMLQERKNVAAPLYTKEEFHIDPLDLFKIGAFNTVFPDALKSHRPGVESLTSAGLLVLAFAAFTLRKKHQRRQLQPWILLATVGAVLACGVQLIIGNVSQFNSLLLLLTGPPGSAFDLPWVNHLMPLALLVGGNPLVLIRTTEHIEFPLGWMMPYVPFLKVFRVPSRFALLTSLCLTIAAAYGFSQARRHWQKRGVSTLKIAGVAMLFLLAEYGIWPYPAADTTTSEFYRQISHENEAFALVPVPLQPNTARMARHEWLQTIHHKPLVAAYVSRPPRNGLRFFNNNDLLKFLFGASEETGTLKASDYPPQKLQDDVLSLRALNVRYIVIHKKYLHPADLACIETVLKSLRLPLIWRDDEIEVFQIGEPITIRNVP